MNICFITRSLPFGKYEAFVIPEIIYTINMGHQVSVIPLRPEGDIIHQDSKTFCDFTVKASLCSFGILLRATQETLRHPLKTMQLLMCIFRSRNARIFFRNLAVFPKALWLANYFEKNGIPDHIHVHWISASATMAMITAEILGVPWSITAHRWDIAENNLLQEKVKACSFVRCINQTGAREIVNFVGASKKIKVLYMGVEIPRKTTNTSINGNIDYFKIVMPANFVEVKGHIYLIEAIKLLREQGQKIYVDFAGDGELKNSMEDVVEKYDLVDYMKFLGEISHSELLQGLHNRRWDCVTLPSIETSSGEKEGIPVSLIEAMAAGVPVISTNTGGILELGSEGAALLVPGKDSVALAEAIIKIMHDPVQRTEVINKGTKRIKESFDVSTVVPRLVEFFRLAEASIGRKGRDG